MSPKSPQTLSSKDLFLGLLVLLIFLSDSLLIYGQNQASFSFKEMILLFIGSRAILFTALIFSYRWGATNRPLILLVLLAGALGPFAFLIGCIAFMCLGFFHLFSNPSHPHLILEEDELNELCEDLTLKYKDSQDYLKTQPFEEILERGEDEQKYLVLAQIFCHYDPSFAPLLKKALNDPSRMIKVSAATILTALDDKFTREIARLEKLVSYAPLQADAWAELAAWQYKYSSSHLTNAQRASQLRSQAIDSYLSFLRIVQDMKSLSLEQTKQIQLAKTHLGLAYLQEGEYQKAYPFLKPSEISYPLSPSELTAELALVPFYCECLFGLRQYSLLKQIAADLLVSSEKDPDLYPLEFQEAIKVWAKDATTRQDIYIHQIPVHEKDDEQDEINVPS